MRSVLNSIFGVVAGTAFAIWCALHIDVFIGIGSTESVFGVAWLGIGLFVLVVAHFEFAFQIEGEDRPGFQGLQMVRSLPIGLRLAWFALSIYVVMLGLAFYFVGSYAEQQVHAPIALPIGDFIYKYHVNGYDGDAASASAALFGTAMMANLCFLFFSYLFFGTHQRTVRTWIDHASSILPAAMLLAGAGVAWAMGEWQSAVLGLIIGSWWWLRVSRTPTGG